MADKLVHLLRSDPVGQTSSLYVFACEQATSLKYLLRSYGMVHLTIVANVAERLGIASLIDNGQFIINAPEQEEIKEEVEMPNPAVPSGSEGAAGGTVAFNGMIIKEEVVTPPPQNFQDDDDDDDCIIEVIDKDQERRIRMNAAAQKAEAEARMALVPQNQQEQQVVMNRMTGVPFMVNSIGFAQNDNGMPGPSGLKVIEDSKNGILGGMATDQDNKYGIAMKQEEVEVVAQTLPLNIEDLRLEPQRSGDTDKPYWLVIDGNIGGRPSFMALPSTASRTNRTTSITSETYTTVPRQQPIFAEQDGTHSMYANWAKPVHNDVETKMNISFMGMVTLKKQTGHHKFWKFTTANKELGNYRMTHSSFWDISTKIRDRQASMSEDKPVEEPDYDAKLIDRLVGVSMPMIVAPEMATAAGPSGIGGGPSTSDQPLMMRSPRPPTPPPNVVLPPPPTPPPIPAAENYEPMIVDEENEVIPTSVVLTAPVDVPVKHEQEYPMEVKIGESSDERPSGIIIDDVGRFRSANRHMKYVSRIRPKHEQIIGGHRTDEVYVYVRGRGRGRYICDRCGIRCKKPSMLKKHIKSHTDIRAFNCNACNFSFKTKGNLTKHLSSKTHQRRVSNANAGNESDGTTQSTSSIMNMEDAFKMEPLFDAYDDNISSDEEEDCGHLNGMQAEHKFKFGQEHILMERTAHTPPTRWCLVEAQNDHYWPSPDRRTCMSAPPVAMQRELDDRAMSPVSGTISPFTNRRNHSPFSAASPRSRLISESQQNDLSTVFYQSDDPSCSSQNPNSFGLKQLPSSSSGGSGGAMINNVNLFQKDEIHKCEHCDRTFRKTSELYLHQHTHNIEYQLHKNRMFQCSECRMPLRTKALLSKHLHQIHGVNMDESVTACIDPSATTQSVLGGPSTSNPRSFMCYDCDIGFRKHGILAKHLRSKTHVMKLESLQKLPADTMSLITRKDNGACLNEVDTTDCERARMSLLAIVTRLRTDLDSEESSSSAPQSVALAPEVLRALTANTLTPAAPSSAPISSSTPPLSTIQHNTVVSSSSSSSSKTDSSCPSPSLANHVHSHSAKTSPSPATTHFIHRKRSESSIMGHTGPTIAKQTRVWNPPPPEPVFTSQPLQTVFVPPEKPKTPETQSQSIRPNCNRPKPIPDNTKCMICHEQLANPIELQVHIHVDHFQIRDGAEFKCPRNNCGLNYETVDCLRAHVKAHYENDQKMLLEEQNLLADVSVIIPSQASSPKVEQKFTTPFKLISDHHEIYNPGPSTSTALPPKTSD
ncbi:hypothetical protein L5515_017078 [Caenorhabditis briggsae]|uniref:C2H2-type domain-containing protein n=1 Tax=Caenorhabditis briggsae TaxID=6238 RepID=A0AAE9FIL8_CAEBR|nr:hypothetical protein L5515_017078 [Caenorhabditis briggsae]